MLSLKNIGEKPDWISYFFCGAIAVCASWFFSGCRVGNDVQQADNPDHYSGYYVTQPTTLTIYATTNHTSQRSVQVSLIPPEVQQVITNPVALVMQDLNTGEAALIAPAGKNYLPTVVNPSSNTLEFNGKTDLAPYLSDPNCLSFLEITENGKVLKSGAFQGPPGNTHPISGKIQLNIHIVTQFEGNCVPTFQAIADCYQDATLCGGDTPQKNTQIQSEIAAILDPLVQTAVISTSDIPNLVNYAYEVSYE